MGTLLLGPASVAAAGFLGALGSLRIGSRGPDAEFTAFVGSTLGILFWLASTVLLWKETAAERMERLRQASGDVVLCPKCGYNLTGYARRYVRNAVRGSRSINSTRPSSASTWPTRAGECESGKRAIASETRRTGQESIVDFSFEHAMGMM